MRLTLLTLLTISLLFYLSCQKKDISPDPVPPDNPPDTTSTEKGKLTEMTKTLEDALNTLYRVGEEKDVDAPTALVNSVEALKALESVAGVTLYDSTCLVLTLKNGLKTALMLRFQGEDGATTTRGGARYSNFDNVLEGEIRQRAKNKNVLFYSPAYREFYRHNEETKLQDIILKSSADATFTAVTDEDCKPSTIRHFGDYGLVLMDTHGLPFAFTAGYLGGDDYYIDTIINGEQRWLRRYIDTEQQLKDHLTTLFGEEMYDLLLTNNFIAGVSLTITQPYNEWREAVNRRYTRRSLEVAATTKYIESLTGLDSTVIVGNFCYSGSTYDNNRNEDGFLAIRDAMVQQPLGAYYGYIDPSGESIPVSNSDALVNELSVVKSFFQDFDTTGNAHRNDANEFLTAEDGQSGRLSTMTLYGQDNIWFGCGGPFADPRDGNIYKSVCIGDRRWMAENLRYNAPGSTINSEWPDIRTFGRLYSFKEATQGAAPSETVPSGIQGACPAGWHVPSNGEWREMINKLGGSAKAGGASKTLQYWTSPNEGATNSSGLSLVPAGSYYPGTDMFGEMGTTGLWWNTSFKNGVEGQYQFFLVNADDAGFYQGLYNQDPGIKISVRCVEDY
jgi:uncharacterized protein (TIGR02145 family)